jgi:hypothetical protein
MMSQDVTVRWKKGKKRPSKAEIKRVIEDYFGPVLRQVKWGRGRYYVYLVGSWTHPHTRVADPAVRAKLRAQRPENEDLRQRCIEVLPSKAYLSTITRCADWFTNDCARGLAKAFSLWWDGKLEMEGSWI